MRLALLAIGIGACGGGQAAVVPARPAVVNAPAPGAAVACNLHAARWPLANAPDAEALPLVRFGPGLPAFAQIVDGTHVAIELPVGRADVAAITLDAEGVTLHGYLDADAVPLWPAVPFLASGVYVPRGRVVWRAGDRGRLTVAANPGRRARPVASELSADVPCESVTLEPHFFEEPDVDAVGRVPSGQVERRMLRPGKVLVSASEDGAPVVEIDSVDPPDESILLHPVRVLSVGASRTRVGIQAYGGALFGWVPTEQLDPRLRQYVDLTHDYQELVVRKPSPPEGEVVTCPRDVPLEASAGGERRVVGTVRAGAEIERRGPAGGGATRVKLRSVALAMVPGGELLVRDADLVGCAGLR